MRLARTAIPALAAMLVATGPAVAQQARPADPELGLELASKLCVACHVISPRQVGGSVPDGVPSFMEIARGPVGEAEQIDRILMQPTHPEMPEPPLDFVQRADVVAYILTLK